MTDTKRQYLYLLPCLALMVTFLLLASDVKAGVTQGLEVCLVAVIPSVFPFTIFSSYLSSLALSGKGKRRSLFFTFLTGLLCGFPLGAKAVVDGFRKGVYTKQESEWLLTFCNNTSLSFLVAGVGGSMRGSLLDGVVLFCIQTTSSLLVAFLSRPKVKTATPSPVLSSSHFSLALAIRDGVFSTLTVCGFVVYFSCLLSLCEHLLPKGLSFALSLCLEVSYACQSLSNHPLGLPLTAFAVCFSGVSVHLQVAALLGDTRLSMKPYLFWKVVSGMIGFAFATLSTFFS